MNVIEKTILIKKAKEAINLIRRMPNNDILEGIKIIQNEAEKAGYRLEVTITKM